MSLNQLYEAYAKSHDYPTLRDASIESSTLISSSWAQAAPQEEKDASWTRTSFLAGDNWMMEALLIPRTEIPWCTPLKEHHGEVYNTQKDTISEWGNLELAYIAEEKRPVNSPYFTPKAESTPEGGTLGEEYAYLETFGEQLEDKSRPCIVIFNDANKESPFTVLNSKEFFNNDYFPLAVQFKSKDVLVGIAVPSNAPYRLGLRYCSNRPSYVFQINTDGSQFSILHGEKMTNSTQIRTTSNGHVFWFDRSLSESLYPGPHRTEVDLMGILTEGGSPQVILEGANFHHDATPKHIELSEDTLILNTITDGNTLCPAVVHVQDKRLEHLEGAKHTAVLDSRHGLVVGVKSSPLEPWKLVAAKTNNLQAFSTLMGPSEYKKNRLFKSMNHSAKSGKELAFNSFFVGPSGSAQNGVPLILIPHGGPHSVTITSHSVFINYLNELGFGVLLVNYRGSIGSNKDTLESLLGNVGRYDVDDCMQALEECCSNIPNLNTEEVFLFGGSHGGFLVTHLAGQYPDRFKGVVALNPVVNIASMASATDIPDWCFNESGFSFDFAEPLTPTKVKAPIYLLIGKNDLRYYKALKGLKKDVTMSIFPDNHSLAKPPDFPHGNNARDSQDGESLLEYINFRLMDIITIIKSEDFNLEFYRANSDEEGAATPSKVSKISQSQVSPGVTSHTSRVGTAFDLKIDEKLQKLEKIVQSRIRTLLDDVGAVKRYCFVKKSTRKFTNEQIITDAIQNLALMEELLFSELERLIGFRMERLKMVSKVQEPFADQVAVLSLCDFRTVTVLKSISSKLIELYIELADLTQGIREENDFANNFFKSLYT
ncbi:Acylaminoacidreleasing enzymelike [Caligus rogercresseyi]|uniref:Acylaminoacidreleasing enzymelike n=1 Tax=Caligus rogercresseyi TaxID=217165 RepID=A0A7T8KKW1_CALRO|nr:Acylaminoacidreleasing enzymelike [Caligus rogercresseyi]